MEDKLLEDLAAISPRGYRDLPLLGSLNFHIEKRDIDGDKLTVM